MERTGNRGTGGGRGRTYGGGGGARGAGPGPRSRSQGGYGSSSHGQQGQGFEGKGRFMRKKVCRLCAERTPSIDFKDTEKLLKFMTEKGKILPQRISGNCAKHQRMLARAVKCARHASLIAFEIGV